MNINFLNTAIIVKRIKIKLYKRIIYNVIIQKMNFLDQKIIVKNAVKIYIMYVKILNVKPGF